MRSNPDVERLIADAFRAEDAEGLADLGEPNLPDAVTEIFRSRMRWYGAMFLFMILVCTVFAIVCGYRFLTADEVPQMMRWGAGFFFAFMAVMGGKTWYWMQVERIAMTREIKRVELLVAHLASLITGSRGAAGVEPP